jgi:hypothetical protein
MDLHSKEGEGTIKKKSATYLQINQALIIL